MRGKSTSNKLIEKPVENSNDFEFDVLKYLHEGPDLGLGEEPKSLLNYLRA